MATKQRKEWVDARGQKVPVGYVSKYDKARDKAVRRVLAGALKLREQMEAFMRDAIATMDALAGMKESLGEKGNDTARQYSISGLPSLLVFKGGQAVERMVGLMPKSTILQNIEKHI